MLDKSLERNAFARPRRREESKQIITDLRRHAVKMGSG